MQKIKVNISCLRNMNWKGGCWNEIIIFHTWVCRRTQQARTKTTFSKIAKGSFLFIAHRYVCKNQAKDWLFKKYELEGWRLKYNHSFFMHKCADAHNKCALKPLSQRLHREVSFLYISALRWFCGIDTVCPLKIVTFYYVECW